MTGIFLLEYTAHVELLKIYQCLCDSTRLRILNLLTRGPLCVCHLQGVLDEPQVKVSKHLAYLKKKGLLIVRRHHNWMIYSLPALPSPELEANLKCLQNCVQTDQVFAGDVKKLLALLPEVGWLGKLAADASCCGLAAVSQTEARKEDQGKMGIDSIAPAK